MDNSVYIDALRALDSMISRSEKAQAKFVHGTSHRSLLDNRIAALRVARALVDQKLTGRSLSHEYSNEDFTKVRAPLISLLSKSEKARLKLKEDSWPREMLDKNVAALHAVLSLLDNRERS